MDPSANNKAIVIAAPSGAGKTSIVRALIESDLPLEFSVSATSRSPRKNEIHGRDYYFIGIDGFKKEVENNGLIEWEEVYPGQFYGTLKREIERIWAKGKAVIFDVDVYGALELKRKLGDNAITIFIAPPDIETLKTRLVNRGTEDEESIETRLRKAAEELSKQKEFDRVVVNDRLETAIQETYQIVKDFLNHG
ncbi:MAG: guanylate kinase [Salibacteraceae bacterium]